MPTSMEFLTFEDNGGAYHWAIVGSDGATLALSGGFASYDDAERAAKRVRNGAAAARVAARAVGASPVVVGASPVDPGARRGATSDDPDAERWLDEGGRVSSEAV